MLAEVLATKPYDGTLRQRWFTDEDFDLTVWHEESGELFGFQLAYDKRAAPIESVLTWRKKEGMDVSYVEEGRAMTAILRSGGRIPDKEVLTKFRRHAKQLEPSFKRMVIYHLRDCVDPTSRA